MEVRGVTITLRLLSRDYFSAYRAMLSPVVQQALHITCLQSEIDYLHNQLIAMQQGRTLFYCIFDNKHDRLVGAIEIRLHNQHRGQLYSWLNEAYWGGGRYQEALALISAEYFKQTHIPFFNAHVDVANVRSLRALRKFGAAHTGFCRGPYGKQYNVIVRKRA